MRVNFERVFFVTVFLFSFFVSMTQAFAQSTPDTSLQGIFGNLNINDAVQADKDFENKIKNPQSNVVIPLVDTHEDKKEIVRFQMRENKLWKKEISTTTDIVVDRGDSKNFFKLKKGFKGNIDEKKLKQKLEKVKGRKFSTNLQNSLTSLKSKRKGLKNEKDQKKILDSVKSDFDTLKTLNQQIQTETDNDVKSTLSTDEQSAVEKVEGNVLFQQDDIYLPNDINNTINGLNDWAIPAVVSENPNIFSTLPTLSRPVLVAVIDSGVDYTHEEIKDNMWKSTSCVDENNNNIVGGCTNGYDFVDNDKDPSPTDGIDHGTAVATLIAGATDNGKGISSLSQNRAKIMALRVADSGFISLDTLTRAVYFAVNNGADVINMSLSGPTYSQSLYDALSYAKDKGVIVIVSSGNQGLDLEANKVYPASYDLTNIYVVGSLDNTGAISSFSNYGIKTVDVLAPGRDVLTGTLANSYSLHTGTSFSAPIFSALVARWISEGKTVSEEILKLNTNASFAQRVIVGRTLAFSGTGTINNNTTVFNRYYPLDNGKYVDLLSKGGIQLDTIPTQLQITTQDTKGATSLINSFASIVSPGTTNLNSPTVLNSGSVTFVWQRPADAKVVGVYLTDVTTNTTTYYEPVSGTSMTLNLVTGHSYRWNTGVSGKTSPSVIGDYNLTAAVAFQIAGAVSAPSVPVPISPLSVNSPGNYVSGTIANLSWNSVSGATSYNVSAKLITGGGYGPYNVTTTNYSMPLPSGSTFYWYVNACNAGGCSLNSASNYYNSNAPVSNQPPTTPTISGPTTGGVNTSLNFNITSTDPNNDQISYNIKWDNDNPSNVVTIGNYSSGQTITQSKSFSTIKNTCIQVQAKDSYNNYSAYSPCYYVNITGTNKPDLVVSSIQNPATSFSPGGTFNLPVNIINQGTIATVNGYRMSVYLNNSILVGQYTRASTQGVNVTDSQNISVTLPALGNSVYTSSGQYNLNIKLDDLNQVDEANENNDFTGNVIINIPTVGKTFTVTSIATQIQNSLFTFTINQTGYVNGTQFTVSADGNSLSQTSFTLNGSGSQSFNLKLLKSNPSQVLKFVVNNSQTVNSNTFSVLADSSISPLVVPNAGNISVTVRNFGNAVVAGANVDICSVICDASKITKVTDTSGIVTFTPTEIGNLQVMIIQGQKDSFAGRRIPITYNKSAPNTATINIVTTANDIFHNPVILIPGISGSTYANDNKVIPVLGSENQPNISKLKIADATGDFPVGSSLYKLGWEDLRKNLEAVGYVRDQTIIDCPYDWRESNDISADVYFASCIQRAIDAENSMNKLPGSYKIDVIAHSMGGLVTRAYIQKNGGANANKIGKIAFMGTPQEGASIAYKVWEGGDPANFSRSLIIARIMQNTNSTSNINWQTLSNVVGLSNNNIISLTTNGISKTYDTAEFSYYLVKTLKDPIYTKDFIQNKAKAIAIKQLIPTYPFLTGVSTLNNIQVSNNNQNEFLLALNSLPCGDSNCDEGKNGGGNYNYKNFKQTLVDAGIVTKMFYGQATTTTGALIDDTDYQYLVDTINKGLYDDGSVVTTSYSGGDQTVPVRSTKTFSENNGIPTASANEQHATLPKSFAKQVTEWVSGQTVPTLASLQAVTVNSHLNVTLGGSVSAYLIDPNGKHLGVNPAGNIAENTIGGDAVATIDATGATLAIDNPTVGNYKLYIEGADKGNYSFYSEFDDTNHKDVSMGTRFHQGSEEVLTFNLTGTTDANAKGLQYDKVENVPQNVVVSNNNGNTRISWNTSADSSITKYRIYSKNPYENNFAQIGEITSNIFDTTNIFAGALETYTKDYRVSAVYADGTETNLTLDYYNNDSDWDGLTDVQEAQYNTLLNKIDTDGDGLPDGVEVNITGTDPTKSDTDGNGIDDYNDNKIKFNLKDKVVAPVANNTIFSENFDRANSSTIGGNFVDGNDTNDNLKIVNNKLSMQWVNQAWGNFHNLYSPLQKQNDLKISYVWNLQSAQGIDGYFPFIGVRGGGTGTNDLNGAYGVALYYYGQGDTLSFHVLDKGALKANLTNIITAPTKNVDYNVEIKITDKNWIEIRIWKVGTTYPATPSTSWNNSNTLYTPNANGNNLVITAFHGSGNAYSISSTLDDLKIENLTLVNATPTIALVGSSTISIFRGSTYSDQGATATDAEDGDLTSKIILAGAVDTTKLGSTTLTYSVSDSKFATTSITRIVNVVADPGPLNLLSYFKLDGATTSLVKYKDDMSLNGILTQIDTNILQDDSNRNGTTSSAINLNGFSAFDTQVPANLNWNNTNTFSAWFKTNNQGGGQTIFGFSNGTGLEKLQIGTKQGYVWVDLYWNPQNPLQYKYLQYYGNKQLVNNIWHKMDVVITNSPNATIKVYVDGVLEKTVSDTAPYNFTSLRNIYQIGTVRNQDSAGGWQSTFIGSVDDLRIYGKELSANDIFTEYLKDTTNMSVSTTTSNLAQPKVKYLFNGPVGSVNKKLESIASTTGVTSETNSVIASARDGSVDGAYALSGSGNIVMNNSLTLATSSQTYSFWYKSAVLKNADILSLANGNRYLNLWLSNGKLYPEIFSNSGAYSGGSVANKNIIDGKWHKIDLSTENSPNQTIKIYVDGVLDSTLTGSLPFNFSPSISTISIGANWNYAYLRYENFGVGTFDDFRIYDKALSQGEITDLYNSEKSGGLASFTLQSAEGTDPTVDEIIPITTIPTDNLTLPEFLQKMLSPITPVVEDLEPATDTTTQSPGPVSSSSDTTIDKTDPQQTTSNIPN